MKPYTITLVFALLLSRSCHSPNRATRTSPFPLAAADSTKAEPHPNLYPRDENAPLPKTHLKDTTYASGSFILFLRPDDHRAPEIEEQTESAGEGSDADADFGTGIGRTEDSLKRNKQFSDIKTLVSTRRYICVKDCKDGPLTIDRDTVNYGYMLSAKGRPIAKTYNNIHSWDYTVEIEDYFVLKKNRPSITGYSVEFMIETIIGISCDDFEKQFQGRIDTVVCDTKDSLDTIEGFLRQVKYSNSKEGIDTRAKFVYVNSAGQSTEICMDRFRLRIDGRPIENFPQFHKYLYSMIVGKQMEKSW